MNVAKAKTATQDWVMANSTGWHALRAAHLGIASQIDGSGHCSPAIGGIGRDQNGDYSDND
jgi:hypothetical protein